MELLAFNAQKFTGSRDRDHAHFSETFVTGHVGTIPGNTPARFEVRTFSRFGADRQTDRPEEAYRKRQRSDHVVTTPTCPETRHTTPDTRHRRKWVQTIL